MVTYEEFSKLEIRIGQIVSAEKIDELDKILKLIVSIGDEERTILAGVAEYYTPEELTGRQIPVVVNLEPRIIRGVASEGMLLAIDVDGKPILLTPEESVPTGCIVR